MSGGNRKPYETATTLDQTLLDNCHDNLSINLEMVVEIETPSGTIYASDRNKYVGGQFYPASVNFPTIKRNLGRLLDPTLQFSTLEIELNNVDGAFNNFLPAGADFDGWINKSVEVKLGLSDVSATYRTIFKGFVTDEGGFSRGTKSISIIARNQFDSVNKAFPDGVLTRNTFSDIEDDKVGIVAPIIYGDWTTNVEPNAASVPAFVVNGNATGVKTDFDENISLFISDNDLESFDTANVYLRRGEEYFLFDTADIVNVGAGNRSFEIRQSATTPAGTTTIDGTAYSFEPSDEFFVRVKGTNLTTYDDNIVEQAKDILKTYGGLTDSDFDATWATYRGKTTPTESATGNVKSRVWIQEPQKVSDFALSLLEQVRLEAFINSDLEWSLSSLHFDDFESSPSHTVKNWDLKRDSLRPQLDVDSYFNRAAGSYNFLPNREENFSSTSFYKNQAAITQAGKEIAKRVVFPNLYIEADVINNLKEILKLASSYFEVIEAELTWRSLLLDVGDFVNLNVEIGATVFEDVPCLVREFGYNPKGLTLPVRLWSLQMVPYSGYSPSYSGIVGGTTATIAEE